MSAYVVCKQESSNCVDTVHVTQHSAGTAAVYRQFGYYNGDSLGGGPSFKENLRQPLAGTANQVPCLASRQVRIWNR